MVYANQCNVLGSFLFTNLNNEVYETDHAWIDLCVQLQMKSQVVTYFIKAQEYWCKKQTIEMTEGSISLDGQFLF